jgi:polyamine oxidase
LGAPSHANDFIAMKAYKILASAVVFCFSSRFVQGEKLNAKDATVIVLGAGVSGIQAAAQLASQGIDFIIIEQADRIGGRMWNVDWAGLNIELGCNWIEGTPKKSNPLWAIAQTIGLEGASTHEMHETYPQMYDETGLRVGSVVDSIWQRLDIAFALSYKDSLTRQWNGRADISLRQSLTSNGWMPETAMEKTAEWFYVEWNFEYGAEDVSLFNFFSAPSVVAARPKRGMPRNVLAALRRRGLLTASFLNATGTDTPHPNFATYDDDYDDDAEPAFFVTDSRGYVAVLQYIADSFLAANDPRLILNTAVTSIEYDKSGATGVTVVTADGREFTADYALCTFSAGVVNAGFASGLFKPAVPAWKSNAFAKAQMGTYTKVFLKFQTEFWDPNWIYALYADPDNYGYYPQWQNLEALGLFFPAGSNVFMATVVNAESNRLEAQGVNATMAEAAAVLKSMYGDTATLAVDARVPIWERNPFFAGSYSNIVVGNTGQDFVDMEKNVGGLWFSGEATDWDWNGFVTGAYFSGDRVAKCIARSIAAGKAVACPQN